MRVGDLALLVFAAGCTSPEPRLRAYDLLVPADAICSALLRPGFAELNVPIACGTPTAEFAGVNWRPERTGFSWGAAVDPESRTISVRAVDTGTCGLRASYEIVLSYDDDAFCKRISLTGPLE